MKILKKLFYLIFTGFLLFTNIACTPSATITDIGDDRIGVVYGLNKSPGNFVCHGSLCECGVMFRHEDENYKAILDFLKSLTEDLKNPVTVKEDHDVSLYIWRGNEDWAIFISGNVTYNKDRREAPFQSKYSYLSPDNALKLAKIIERNATGIDIICKKGQIKYPHIGIVHPDSGIDEDSSEPE